MTNAGKLGTKARFFIDAESREILHEGYIPRQSAQQRYVDSGRV